MEENELKFPLSKVIKNQVITLGFLYVSDFNIMKNQLFLRMFFGNLYS